MCIRDRYYFGQPAAGAEVVLRTYYGWGWRGSDQMPLKEYPCLLYTSDAADERSSGDLGGRRIIKKKIIKKTKKKHNKTIKMRESASHISTNEKTSKE